MDEVTPIVPANPAITKLAGDTLTTPLNVTVSWVTRDRWADPSLTRKAATEVAPATVRSAVAVVSKSAESTARAVAVRVPPGPDTPANTASNVPSPNGVPRSV